MSKAFPLDSCYDCPARAMEDEYKDYHKVGVIPVCLYDWYEDKGPKRTIEALGLALFPDWCPLKDYKEDVNP